MLAWFGDLLTQRRRGAEKRRGIQGDELSTPSVLRGITKPFSLRLCVSILVFFRKCFCAALGAMLAGAISGGI
jgi:hypothetical protein